MLLNEYPVVITVTLVLHIEFGELEYDALFRGRSQRPLAVHEISVIVGTRDPGQGDLARRFCENWRVPCASSSR